MTNGEMIQKVFNCEVCEPIPEDDIIHVVFSDKSDSAIGFDWSWWNMEYKEPTTKNNSSSELEKNSKKLEKDFGELDCISRADAIRVASGYCHPSNVAKELAKLPSVTPQQMPCDDCISRQAVLEYIEGSGAELGHGSENELVCQDIKELPPVIQQPRWISVSERLPEKDGEYLLWGKICEDEENNYCFIGEYDSCAEEFGYWSDHYDSSTLGFLDSEHIEYHKVLAWMPLPKPYEPQESEDKE